MFNIFRQKTEKNIQKTDKENESSYTFTDEDREHSLALRRLRSEIKKTQLEMEKTQLQAQLNELKDDIAYYNSDRKEDNGLNADSLLMTMLLPLLSKNLGGNDGVTQSNTLSSNTPPVVSEKETGNTQTTHQIRDEEIREFLDGYDRKKIKIAKTLPKTMVYRAVTQQMPLTNEEFERAYKILKEEY